VELSGRVRDKTIIRAQSLEVSLTRSDARLEVMFGECELAVGEAPNKAAAVRDATSSGARAAAPATEAPSDGAVAAEADASQSTRNGRRGKRPDDSASHAENA
jgi:hypothetical protein